MQPRRLLLVAVWILVFIAAAGYTIGSLWNSPYVTRYTESSVVSCGLFSGGTVREFEEPIRLIRDSACDDLTRDGRLRVKLSLTVMGLSVVALSWMAARPPAGDIAELPEATHSRTG